jgi:hydroxymethylpyrimidine pyrophosphatase-like HAD family hydrolase
MRFVGALAGETGELPRVAVIQGTKAIARIREELVPRFASTVNFFASVGPTGRPNLTITSIAASKGEALAAACAHLGLEPTSVVAFGDAENDIEMFRLAGASVAMGQADDHVKAEATSVSATNVEAGVARAIEKLLATGAV